VLPINIAHFDLQRTEHKLVPTDELEVISCNLGDFYDLKTAGVYYVEVVFEPGKVKFTGGTSNYIAFSVK